MSRCCTTYPRFAIAEYKRALCCLAPGVSPFAIPIFVSVTLLKAFQGPLFLCSCCASLQTRHVLKIWILRIVVKSLANLLKSWLAPFAAGSLVCMNRGSARSVAVLGWPFPYGCSVGLLPSLNIPFAMLVDQ